MKLMTLAIFLGAYVPTHASIAATLSQFVLIEGRGPGEIYNLYLNSETHSAITGKPANIEARVGGKFEAFKGIPDDNTYGLTGRFLAFDNNTRGKNEYNLVQTWRGHHDLPDEADSTLSLTFREFKLGERRGTEIELVQSNVPDRLRAAVDSGWNEHYWNPLRKYLADHPAAERK